MTSCQFVFKCYFIMYLILFGLLFAVANCQIIGTRNDIKEISKNSTLGDLIFLPVPLNCVSNHCYNMYDTVRQLLNKLKIRKCQDLEKINSTLSLYLREATTLSPNEEILVPIESVAKFYAEFINEAMVNGYLGRLKCDYFTDVKNYEEEIFSFLACLFIVSVIVIWSIENSCWILV